MHAQSGSVLAEPRLSNLDDSAQSELDIPSPAPRDGPMHHMNDVRDSSNFTPHSFHDKPCPAVLSTVPVNTVLAAASPHLPKQRRLCLASPVSSSGTASTEIFATKTQLTGRRESPSQVATFGTEDSTALRQMGAKTMSKTWDSREVEEGKHTNDRIDTAETQQGEEGESTLDLQVTGHQKGRRGYRAEYDELRRQYQSLRDEFFQLQQQRHEERQRQQHTEASFVAPAPSATVTVKCGSASDCHSTASNSSLPQLIHWFTTDDDSTIVVDVTVESDSPLPQQISQPSPNPIAPACPCPVPRPAPSAAESDANPSAVSSWLASIEAAGDSSTVAAETVSPPPDTASATMRGLLRAVASLSESDALEAKRHTEPLVPPLALELCRATRPFARQLLLLLVRESAGSGGIVTPTMCAEAINDVLAAGDVRDVRATRRLCSRIAATCEDAEMETEGDGCVRRVPYASFIAQVMQLAEGEKS